MQKPLWFVSRAWEGDSLLLFVLAWLFWLLEEVGAGSDATGASRGNSLGPGRVVAEAAGPVLLQNSTQCSRVSP